MRNIQIAEPCVGDEEWEALREPLRSGWLTQGPKVAEFERAFAATQGVRHAVAVTSCTTALHLSLLALDIGPGDEVIVPAFTWVSTPNSVIYCGARAVLVDVDRHTFNVDIDALRAAVTPRTKAVIPVHLFGLCADMDAVRDAVPPGVFLIEDAACATGATYKGRGAGGLGQLGCFSFHPRKAITTGEGGMVTTDDAKLAERVRVLRSHGASVPEEARHGSPRPHTMSEFNVLGYNYRMTDLQAAMGIVQLGKLERFISERARWARYYRERLADLKWLRTPQEPSDGRHAWQAFVTYVDPDQAPRPRNDIMDFLHERGIATRVGTHAVHTLAYYRNTFGYQASNFPGAHDCELNSMALPLHNRMTEDDYAYVVDALCSL